MRKVKRTYTREIVQTDSWAVEKWSLETVHVNSASGDFMALDFSFGPKLRRRNPDEKQGSSKCQRREQCADIEQRTCVSPAQKNDEP
jgi:hypothetical protein